MTERRIAILKAIYHISEGDLSKYVAMDDIVQRVDLDRDFVLAQLAIMRSDGNVRFQPTMRGCYVALTDMSKRFVEREIVHDRDMEGSNQVAK